MSDQATPAAPAVATPTPAQPVADTAAPAKIELTSDALKARLDETRGAERAKLLKKFGVDSETALEAKLKKLGELEQASLTEQEKTAARVKELEAAAARATTLEQRLAREVERKVAALPEAQRAKLIEKAGDDLNKRLEYLDILEEFGALGTSAAPAQASPSTSSAAPPAPPPPPANTSGGANAPRPTAAQTKFEEYEDTRKRLGDMAGEIFYRKHRLEIEKTRPANA